METWIDSKDRLPEQGSTVIALTWNVYLDCWKAYVVDVLPMIIDNIASFAYWMPIPTFPASPQVVEVTEEMRLRVNKVFDDLKNLLTNPENNIP